MGTNAMVSLMGMPQPQPMKFPGMPPIPQPKPMNYGSSTFVPSAMPPPA